MNGYYQEVDLFPITSPPNEFNLSLHTILDTRHPFTVTVAINSGSNNSAAVYLFCPEDSSMSENSKLKVLRGLETPETKK